MISSTWLLLKPFIDHPRRSLAILALSATIGGFADAGVLVLVVHTALSLADGSDQLIRVPILGARIATAGLLTIAMILAILSMGIHVLVARLSAAMSTDVFQNARESSIHAFSQASWDRQAKEREGALQETVMTLSQQSSELALRFVTGVAAALNLFALLAAAALVDPVTMVLVLASGLLLFAALRPMGSATRRRAQAFVAANSSFAEEVSRYSTLAMEFRSFGVQERASQRLLELSNEASHLQYRTRFASRFGATLYRDLAVLFLVGAIAILYLVGGSAVLGAGTVVLLIVRAMSSAQAFQSHVQVINEQGPNLVDLHARIDSLASEREVTGADPLTQVSVVELVDVTYRYGSDAPALKGVNIRVERNEILGVVGPSGGGKSTLVQVLLRLRVPQRGDLRMGGVASSRFAPADWTRLVSFVPQEPSLMEATIAENIAFLRPGITKNDIQSAARSAHVLRDVERLPAGFETMLGPRGGGLSGGQKQRIAIARALVGRPELLVLDEPTSALDINSERLLQETIEALKGSITMIIVAHRLTTLSACDRILVLSDGEVELIGTPDELMRQPGFFRTVNSSLVKEAAVAETAQPSAPG